MRSAGTIRSPLSVVAITLDIDCSYLILPPHSGIDETGVLRRVAKSQLWSWYSEISLAASAPTATLRRFGAAVDWDKCQVANHEIKS